jgi:hypothetical protein
MTIEKIEAELEAGLPQHMRGGLRGYVLHGRRPGGFLTAMLDGRLRDARAIADAANLRAWSKWEIVLSDCIPLECYNTPQKVEASVAAGGLRGRK